jgi:hypothetical protein
MRKNDGGGMKKREDAGKLDLAQFETKAKFPKTRQGNDWQSLVDFDKTVQVLSSETGIGQKQLESIVTWNLQKVSLQDRDDLLQEFSIALLEVKPRQANLAYAICRNQLVNWHRHSSYVSKHEIGSLNWTVEDEDGEEVEAIELVAGEVEFEYKLASRIDANTLFQKLPPRIKRIVARRLLGIKIKHSDVVAMRWFILSPKGQALLILP